MAYVSPLTREFITARVDVNEETTCWIWRLSVDRHGYGLLGPGAQERLAHRLSYRLFNGEIPDYMTVDHLCFVTDCVNPAHLRLLTVSENAGLKSGDPRAIPTRALRQPATHCNRDHEFTPENTRVYAGRRTCQACRRLRRSRKAG